MGGTDGTDSWPHAVMRTSASWGPALVASDQRFLSASQVASVTSVPVRMRSRTPSLRATSST